MVGARRVGYGGRGGEREETLLLREISWAGTYREGQHRHHDAREEGPRTQVSVLRRFLRVAVAEVVAGHGRGMRLVVGAMMP